MHLVADVNEQELMGIEKFVDGHGRFQKTAVTPMEKAFLRNEYRMLQDIEGWAVAPRPIGYYEYGNINVLIEDYLGNSEPVTDEAEFRRGCAHVLLALQEAGVVHGDLTRKNLIVRKNRPYVVDFHQSRLVTEPGPDKRPEGDAYHLWRAAAELSPDTSRHLRKWQAIREVLLPETGAIKDLGCAEGDYLLFAIAEDNARPVIGVDHHPESATTASRLLWGVSRDAAVHKEDIFAHLERQEHTPILFMMSVYAHLVRQRGREQADQAVQQAIAQSDLLLFETHYHGDGPGPAWHPDKTAVIKDLHRLGATTVAPLVSIPVHGRAAVRTVWEVRS